MNIIDTLPIPMTAAEFLKLWKENEKEAPDGCSLALEGDWNQEGKCQYCADVFLTGGGQYFEVVQSRAGSYRTDWYYDDPDCEEVTPLSVVTINYVPKKAPV